MDTRLVNGKDICLQRLRGNSVTKSLRFLEQEINNKLFDFNAKKYDFYREEDTLNFKKIKKSEFVKQLKENKRPLWISNTEFSKIIQTTDEKIRLDLIDRAIASYDQKTDRYYNQLIKFSTKQNDYLRDKGQNILFNIEYLITGKLESGEIIRFPFALREIKKINIDKNNKKIKLDKSNKYIANIPFLTWLGNKQNKEIESKIEKIGFLDESNFIEKQIEIFSYLGINLKKDEFDKLTISKPLKLNRENRSLSEERKTAIHEFKHASILFHYGFFIESLSINEDIDTLGKTIYKLEDEDLNYEAIVDSLISPHLEKAEFQLENFNLSNLRKLMYDDDHKDTSDINKLFLVLSWIDFLHSDDEKEKFLIKAIARTKNILKKYENKQPLFVEYLSKHKIMDSDEIMEQFNSDTLIESYNNVISEMKLEKNSFQVEKVELIAILEHLIDHEIYRDTKAIFDTNYVDKLFEKDFSNKGLIFDEAKVSWGFEADISQQKAVFETLNFNKLLIQGPPGTGKTQTILNIISDSLSKGKKILVVSEKITAVEVILERFWRDSEITKSLILDLYNVEYEGIDFYKNMGNNFKKIINFDSNSDAPTFSSMNAKLNKLHEISNLIEQLDLKKNYDKVALTQPSKRELDIFNKIEIDNFDKLKIVKKEEYDNFVKWNIAIEKIRKIFPSNISNKIITKLIDLNKIKPYSELTWINFASLLTTGKEKINFFSKWKFKKMKKEKQQLDKLFLENENFEIIKYFDQFNGEKYSDQDKIIFRDYEALINNNISIHRIEEINKYTHFMNDLNDIKQKIFAENPTEYIDINNKEMFEKIQRSIMSKHSEKIKKILNNHRNVLAEFERLSSRQVMNAKVKSFLKDYWYFVKEIFPIVLSTPELVSKYLPLDENLYDIVIIDEASQFLLERSLPSLYRGKKIIISGDKNQLRPNISGQRFDSLAELNEFNDVEYKELIENESILDLFDYLYKDNQVMLQTHYRSKRQELIYFSNENFYQNKLAFLEEKSNNIKNPIKVVNVEGKWNEQTNEIEALKIIEIINDLLTENISASVGVILFTKKQANFIKKIIYKENKYPLITKVLESLDANGLFIKSLDQVQGEERDIIIFGITYGNNVSNYGYLSRRYGENRINVAITRAKEQIIIVKSHKSGEYRRTFSSSTSSKGPETLFNYLKYAEEISEGKEVNSIVKVELEESFFLNHLKKTGTNIYKEILIHNNKIYINENDIAFYLIDSDSLKNPREKIWFFEKILISKGYTPKAIYITDIFPSHNILSQ